MTIADRIQSLRKSKGISQEELADRVGVSRQAVSKWESEQSTPDLDKIIILSDYFEVTTDYLLKGIEPEASMGEKQDARIFSCVGTALNLVGIVVAIMVWTEEQSQVSAAIGLIIMAMGCMIFAVGQFCGENRQQAARGFALVNVWFLTLIPVSFVYNVIASARLGMWSWLMIPVPTLKRAGSSILMFGLAWLIYAAICVCTDAYIILNRKKK